MTTQIQRRRGTTAQHSTFTGAEAELTVDTTKDTVVVHDGSTVGGRPLLREDQSNLPTSAPTTGIYNASGSLAISTGGSGRLFVDASGRVGIGTTSPGDTLHVSGSIRADVDLKTINQGKLNLGSNQGGGAVLLYNTNGNLDIAPRSGFSTTFLASDGGTERARIDSSGRLLVGTSSGRGVGGSLQALTQIETTNYVAYSAVNNTNDTGGPALMLGKSRGTAVGSNTIVQNGDNLGDIYFAGADGADLESIAARITCTVDGAPGANDMPGRLVFSTTADGASSPTERMRITAAGNIECNVGSSTQIASILSFTGGQIKQQYRSFGTGSVNIVEFVRDTGGTPTTVGTISTTGSATAYNTSSDYRLKENIEPVSDGIIRLQQLKPSRFNFINSPNAVVDGFIAHEVQDVVPEAITGKKDAVDDEGNPVYQAIDQSKLVPLLTAALQEAITKIESLEARLTAAGI